MDTAIRAAYEVFGCATQQEFEEWDLERRREKARFDMGSRLSGARREGREEGEQIGLQKGSIEIARKLKKMGIPVGQIAEGTGLPSEVIATL